MPAPPRANRTLIHDFGRLPLEEVARNQLVFHAVPFTQNAVAEAALAVAVRVNHLLGAVLLRDAGEAALVLQNTRRG